jgi:hypothetical protein
MNINILKMAGIGVAIVAVVVGILFFSTLGSQIRLEGEIQQVRTLALDDKSTLVIVDFHFDNPADYPFVVRDATVHLEDAEGGSQKGRAVAKADAERILDYYSKKIPELGPQYNEVMISRDRIEPKATFDRMICARFEVPESVAKARARVKVRIEDVDGAISELAEDRESE